MIFAVFDLLPSTECTNCSFFTYIFAVLLPDLRLYRHFPDNHFPGQTFPDKTFPGQVVSRTITFPDRRFPDRLY